LPEKNGNDTPAMKEKQGENHIKKMEPMPWDMMKFDLGPPFEVLAHPGLM